MNVCYLFATGGTGGHLMPALAVAAEIVAKQPDAAIVFVGSERPVERLILEPTGYEHFALPVQSLSELRKHPLQFLSKNRTALRAAAEIVETHRPRAVIGCGGFASVPAVHAAARSGVPVVLLEQNAVPGRATSWLCSRAQVVCLAFDACRSEIRSDTRCVVTGNPVRPDIAALATASTDRSQRSNLTMLILGGSQGARAINSGIVAALGELTNLPDRLRIIHQTGGADCPSIQQRYESLGLTADVRPFLDDMPELLGQADLVVSRAGGTTLAELACAGVPVVLIPAPRSVRDHQRRNAVAFAESGAAVVVEESADPEETGQRLAPQIFSLLTDGPRWSSLSAQMRALARPDAAAAVLAELESIV